MNQLSYINIVSYSFGILILVFLIYSAIISLKEKEKAAATRLYFAGVILAILYLLPIFINFTGKEIYQVVLIVPPTIALLIFLIPIGRSSYKFQAPTKRINERDTMFSRRELKPGTGRYLSYYSKNPDKEEIDKTWRNEAGLLSNEASQYHPLYFASSHASFETIDYFKDKVDGTVKKTKTTAEPEQFSKYIKGWGKKLGAIDIGITKLKDYHVYSKGGRGERYDQEYLIDHKFAIAFTVEMDKEMVDGAPTGSIVMESAQQYLDSGSIAIQIANFIRRLGYPARAHIDGNYKVVCPLVARDAGLGEIGRMGLLMTPKLGPRVRIAVVTTDLPLETDEPLNDYSFIDFCLKCKKCADACPSQAISFDRQKMIDGTLRWQINQEKCFELWCKLGTDCGRCVSVCPYSHPDNSFHNLIRIGLKRSSLFRILALKLDDLIYGRKPPTKALTEWMRQ